MFFAKLALVSLIHTIYIALTCALHRSDVKEAIEINAQTLTSAIYLVDILSSEICEYAKVCVLEKYSKVQVPMALTDV